MYVLPFFVAGKINCLNNKNISSYVIKYLIDISISHEVISSFLLLFMKVVEKTPSRPGATHRGRTTGVDVKDVHVKAWIRGNAFQEHFRIW